MTVQFELFFFCSSAQSAAYRKKIGYGVLKILKFHPIFQIMIRLSIYQFFVYIVLQRRRDDQIWTVQFYLPNGSNHFKVVKENCQFSQNTKHKKWNLRRNSDVDYNNLGLPVHGCCIATRISMPHSVGQSNHHYRSRLVLGEDLEIKGKMEIC